MNIIYLIITVLVVHLSAGSVLAADVRASSDAINQLQGYLSVNRDNRSSLPSQQFATVPLTGDDVLRAMELLWGDHIEHILRTRSAEIRARQLTLNKQTMPFSYTVTGNPGQDGRSLYISLHGGGGTSKAENDGQWKNQKQLYQIPEGVYFAPRAPTDTWNMWHQDNIDAMLDRIIYDFIIFEEVNPNRVYILGYSAGGDGVYQLAPRMADRWAAAAMMAGHPNDASPVSLFNTPFTIHVGANDGAYDRNVVASKWGQQLDILHSNYPGGYIHWTQLYKNTGHWIENGAKDALPWLAQFTRNPLPKDIIWEQNKHQRFYWLATRHLTPGTVIRASLREQEIYLQSVKPVELSIRLNDAMLDLNRPVRVLAGDTELFHGYVHRTIATLAATLEERGDPTALFSGEINIKIIGANSVLKKP